MKRKSNIEIGDEKPLDPYSSLNNYFLCECGVKFNTKHILKRHITKCNGIYKGLVCHWCNLKFKNRGNLIMHLYSHGDKSARVKCSKQANAVFKCNVCDTTFCEKARLKYHIRRKHFNLYANIPQCEDKKINQTWFEKVLNTDLMVKIKKTGVNTLVLKPVSPSPQVKSPEAKHTIDLSLIYPTGQCNREESCKICNKVFKKNNMKKHMNEKHLNKFKMKLQ